MTQTEKVNVWIDCDPGNDDAIALLVAVYSHYFNLVGVSTVHGNTVIQNTTFNALALMTAFGQEQNIPVYQGYEFPMERTPKTAHHIHGAKGLGGHELLPQPTASVAGYQEEFKQALKKAILKYNGQLSIVAIGPLTNVGVFFKEYPDMRHKIKTLSIMGAAVSDFTWNIGEFNITTDPEAAKLVLEDEIISPKLIVIPSDLTRKAIATQSIQKEILGDKTKLRNLFYNIIMCFAENYRINKGFLNGPPVHDPLAVLALLDVYHIENLLSFQYNICKLHVNCDTSDTNNYGRVTIVEDGQSTGAKIGYDVNVSVLWDIILDCVTKADEVACINRL